MSESKLKQSQNAVNLKKWAKGQSGNITGRPKGSSLLALLRQELDEDVTVEAGPLKGQRVTKAEAIVRTAVDLALLGDFHFAKMVIEMLEGKPTQQVEIRKQSLEIKLTLEAKEAAAKELAEWQRDKLTTLLNTRNSVPTPLTSPTP